MKSKIIIPAGFVHVCGNENNGFVIQSPTGNEFVWVPGGETKQDGYCDGFYVSRYEISKKSENCFMSVPNQYPIVDIDFFDAIGIAQMYEDSSDFGNYKNVGPHKAVKTGYNPRWMCKNIDNLAGNLWTWTCTGDEKSKILRGGCCMLDGQYAPLGRKCRSYLEGSRFYTGLRVVLKC